MTKYLSLNASNEEIQYWRKLGYTIVFTAPTAEKCGCHDCVQFGLSKHPGDL